MQWSIDSLDWKDRGTEDIIKQCTEQPQFGFLGDARVNVLKVNLMLDGVL